MPHLRDAAARVRGARTGAVALIALAAIVLSGCGAQPKPAPSATALPAGVTATLLPATPAQAADEVRLWVDNTTDEDLTLSRVRIDDPSFDGIGRKATSGSVRVAAGQSAEIVVALPAVACEADAAASATVAPTPSATAGDGATATIGFALGAAIGIAVTPIADPEGVVAARIASVCG